MEANNNMEERLYIVKQVATLLQLNEQTVYRMAMRGELPAVKVGRNWRFRKEDIEQWLEQQARITKEQYREGED